MWVETEYVKLIQDNWFKWINDLKFDEWKIYGIISKFSTTDADKLNNLISWSLKNFKKNIDDLVDVWLMDITWDIEINKEKVNKYIKEKDKLIKNAFSDYIKNNWQNFSDLQTKLQSLNKSNLKRELELLAIGDFERWFNYLRNIE